MVDVTERVNMEEEASFNVAGISPKAELPDETDNTTQPNDELANCDEPNDDEDRNAAIAAAVADFDADDQDEENDGDDDTVNVIIKPSKSGIYKTGAAYQARSLSIATQHQKAARQGVELDSPGNINGVPTLEFNLSSLGDEDKPWKRPGADITDYFNYGFTEETWIQYCEKQKILRQEYANTTIKPVLSGGGANLLQRIRTGAANSSVRAFENPKQANINVINLSNSVRANTAGLLPNSKMINSSVESPIGLLNGTSGNSVSLLNQFNQPPPGYLSGTQPSGNTAGAGVFNIPPPGFPPTAAPHILNAANASATAAALFPNLAVPPPVVNNIGWNSNNISLSGLMGSGDIAVDPVTGQIGSLMDHGDRSPGSGYDNYRSRRRSRSGSRDRYHSRHHRHRDSPHSSREYEKRSGASRHSHRSREGRHSSSRDDHHNRDASGSRRSTERRSDRDRDRYAHRRDRSRSRGRERSRHRTSRHERERSTRSRQGGRHSSRHKEMSSKSPQPPTSSPNPPVPKMDPLSAAAAAAANIAVVLGTSNA